MSRVIVVFACCLLTAPAFASSPDPKDLTIPPGDLARAHDLIRRLGSEVYREREEAQAELSKMGRLARPALLEAACADPDPEIRFRCSRLLPRAGAEDLKARLETFLADSESKFEHNLPGLKQFRKIVGADRQARDLFVEIFKSQPNLDLLQGLEKSTAEAGRAVADRRMMLWGLISQRNFNGRIQPPQSIPFPDIACLLFAETIVASKDIPRTNMWTFVTGATFLQQQQGLVNSLNGNGTPMPHADAYKRLIAHWLETRTDPLDLNQLPYAAGQLLTSFKESQPLLRRIVTTEGVYGYAKAQALKFLVDQRLKEEEPLLLSLLGNDSLVTTVWFGNVPGQQPVQHQCLLRDVALAILLGQSGQKLRTYGFVFPGNVEPSGQTIGYGNYALPSEEARTAAFIKYGFWRMKQVGVVKEPAAKDKAPAPKPAPSIIPK